MKNRPIKIILVSLLVLTLAACAAQTPAPTTQPEPSATSAETATSIPPTETTRPTQTNTPTPAAPTETPTPSTTPTATIAPTKTETIGEMLKTHIVFYLLLPEKKRRDACGDITPIPIISKRLITGDKIQDFLIALNMMFSVGGKYYGIYYNAMWDTDFTIENYQYNAKKDYITVEFGGYFPYTKLSSCDKHGIREQIWTTWKHYKFKEKTFKVADGFLIDRLGGD